MLDNRPIGAYARMLAKVFRRRTDEQVSRKFPDLTATQAQTMGYIMHCKNKEMLTRDFEVAFEIQGSTACRILQSMERKGLIQRVCVKDDSRKKKIALTDKALDMNTVIVEELKKVEERARAGISEEDLECFCRVADKIYENLALEEEKEVWR